MDHVGKRIRKLRVERQLTQQQLAKAIGIKQGSLTQLETGKSKSPASATLTKLARLFEVDAEWLMSGRGERHPVAALSENESELVLIFRSLTPEGRDYVLGRARRVHQDEYDSGDDLPRRRSTDDSPPSKNPKGPAPDSDGH